MPSKTKADVVPEIQAPHPLHQTLNTCNYCGRTTVAPCQTVPDMMDRISEGDRVCRETLDRVGGGDGFPNPSSATLH